MTTLVGMGKIVSLVMVLALMGCGGGLDEQKADARVGAPVLMVDTLGLSGACLTDQRFLPPEVVTITPHEDGAVATLMLDFGEAVEVAWKDSPTGNAWMGGCGETGSQWTLLGGSFQREWGVIRWDGPTGACTQNVSLSLVR